MQSVVHPSSFPAVFLIAVFFKSNLIECPPYLQSLILEIIIVPMFIQREVFLANPPYCGLSCFVITLSTEHWSHWAAPGSIFSHPPTAQKPLALSSLNPTKADAAGAEWFSRHRVFSFQCYLNIHSEHLKFPTIVVEKQEHAAKLNGAGSFKTVHGIVQPTVLSHNYDVYLKHCIRVPNCGPNFVIVLDDGIIGCVV